jgi:uncharacterized protein YbjT (DUF2867 family)
MSTILVTGPSGFVGSHLLPVLIDAGHRIRGLARTPGAEERVRARLSPSQVEAVTFARGDVTDPESLRRAAQGVDAIVHLVAIPRDWNGGRDLEWINLDGTRNVLQAARDAGVRRFIHLGALGVTDDPNLHFARSKARSEQAVRESDLDWTVLKPSLLFGERDGFFNQIALLARISPGIMPIPAGARSRFQPFSVDDLAHVVQLALEREDTAGHDYELGGPDRFTYRQMVEITLREMGKRRLLLPMPQPLIRLVARGSEVIRLPFPVSSDQLRQLRLDNIGPLDGVREAFGFEPRPVVGNLGYLRGGIREQDPARR